MPKTEKKYVSEVIRYDVDIAPYRFVKIFAGVGSGKNTFVDNLVKGNIILNSDGSKVKPLSVLLVTSRRTKANEQRESKDVKYDAKVGLFDDESSRYYYSDDQIYEYEMSAKATLPDFSDGIISSEICIRSCCCTNAQMERTAKEYTVYYSPSMPWYRFDLIVIDEVHELIADATYQDAPFYVRRLIEMTLASDTPCKVIAMTGSPEILQGYKLLEDAHELDYMQQCVNLVPKEVYHVYRGWARNKLLELLRDGKKSIYFSNTIAQIMSFLKNDDLQAFSNGIAASFTDTVKRATFKRNFPVIFGNTEDTEKEIASSQSVPDNILLLFSTAKNEEGINIKNEDIKSMFVEAHAQVDVVQMAGRLRKGLDTLYVIYDATTHESLEIAGELVFTQESSLLKTVNDRFYELLAAANYDPTDEYREPISQKALLEEYVSFIHAKFDYIRFDYYTNKFVFYDERANGRQYYQKQYSKYINADSKVKLAQLTKEWFPTSKCKVMVEFQEEKKRAIVKYLEDHQYIGKVFHAKEEEEIITAIKQITGESFSSFGPYLKKYGLRCIRHHKYANEPRYIEKI